MSSHISARGTLTRPSFAEDLQQLTAIDVMQYGVVSIEKTAPVYSAAALLVEKQISGLPVTYEGNMVGILSEKDLLRLFYANGYLPGAVEDYMTNEVVSFDIGDRVSDICSYLVECPFRRVPILNGRTIAGMVTRADLIKVYRRQILAACRANEETVSPEALAEDIMYCGLLTVNAEAPLTKAMDLIVKFHVSGLPVVDGKMGLMGIITEKDILLHLCKSKIIGMQVQDIMTRDVVVFSPKDSVNKICACLICNSFHRVPIVNKGKLLGIISRADVLKYRCSIFKK
jgi:CBS domain-containing protein